eukprot:COSAG06_NODE_221_length_19912_cov_17.460875_22_plen_31_part_00
MPFTACEIVASYYPPLLMLTHLVPCSSGAC